MQAVSSDSPYLPHIDGLRAIAVISVLLFHVDVSLFIGGFVGVDIFFVISGFLITRLIRDEVAQTGSLSFRRFYLRRIRRLFPALAATLLLTTIAACLFFSPAHLYRFGAELSFSMLSVSNFYFVAEADYFDTSALFKPLLHTWSLSVEEQFYLVWPLTLVMLLNWRASALPAVLLLAGCLSLALTYPFADGEIALIDSSLPVLTNYLENGKSTVFFLLPFRIFEFALGAMAVWHTGWKNQRQGTNSALAAAGLAMIVISVLTVDENMLFPAHNALLPCIGTALLILYGHHGRIGQLLAHRSMVQIGLLSYSLYLVHWPIAVFTRYLTLDTPFTLLEQIFILTASAFTAVALNRLVETPFRRNAMNWSNREWAARVSLIVTVVCIGGAGFVLSDGWKARLDSESRAIAALGVDFGRSHYGGAGYPYYGFAVKDDVQPGIVLIGDSHARHYAEGLNTIVAIPRRSSLFVAAGTSCLHLPGYTRITPGTDWDRDCPAALQEAINVIRKAEQPPLVVVSHFWLYQQSIAARLTPDGLPLHEAITDEDLLKGVLELEAAIQPAPLVVLGTVPSSDEVDLFDIFTRPDLIGIETLNRNDYTSNLRGRGQPAENSRFNDKLARLAEDTGVFVFLDPFDALCNEQSCRNIIDSKDLIYSDPGHLSLFGSRYVIRYFESQIGAALDSRIAQSFF